MKWDMRQLSRSLRRGLERYRTALLVMAVGILLLLLPLGEGEKESRTAPDCLQTQEFDLQALEDKLAKALSAVEGAGETRVLLSLESGSRQLLAQDVEREGQQSRSQVVTIGSSASGEQVVPLQTLSPQFRGALVVCPGGDDPWVRLQLSQAVSVLTGLGSDRITICKGT